MAYNFNRASNQRIEVHGLPDFTTQITIAATIKLASLPQNGFTDFHTIISKHQVGGSSRNFDVDIRASTGNCEISWSQPAGSYHEYQIVGPGVGNWGSLIWTVDWTTNPDTVKGYLNGVPVLVNKTGGLNNTTPDTNPSQVVRIGSVTDIPVAAFDGDIAEVAVWPLVLTDGEALALGKGYSPLIVHPADVRYIPLIRDLMDVTGRTTLVNQGATVAPHCRVIYPG